MDKKNYATTILLVEDDVISKKIIIRFLNMYKVIAVSNGIEAIETFNKESVDLILMDVRMPEMDGITATLNIRQIEKYTKKHIPIIAVTACALNGDREKCIEAGMDDYITKPIDLMYLLDIIEKWI